MIDLKQLQALTAIVDEQSFERAAQSLHITQSAISQRLKQLETQMGQQLILRGPPPRATETARQLIKHFRQVYFLQCELERDLATAQLSALSTLSIGVNADSLASWLMPALTPFLQTHPLALDLRVDDQDVTQALLRRGEVLGCVSASEKPLQGCQCEPLGVMDYRCWASPDFYRQHFAQGLSPAAWQGVSLITYNHKDQLQSRYLRQFFQLDAQALRTFRVPDSHAFIECIKRGLACGVAPVQQARPLVERGELVDVSPAHCLAVPLYWHGWQLQTPLLRELVWHLQQSATQSLRRFDDPQPFA